jgi:hypothetical protein
VCGGKEHKTNTNDVAKVREETRFFFKKWVGHIFEQAR